MLKNIKSIYFIRILFSHIIEKQKLKVVKYNKSLQKYIDISIINYKFFSGRYIIYESNGIGKEYYGYDDKLLFEGEYLNGKRSGKGKKYDYKGNLVFEGEYLNGKRNGKGKEYDKYGRLIFEGEYLNGKRNGKGKEYYEKKLIFEGEYLNGKKWNGTGYYQGGNIIYTLSNNINGKGKEYNWSGQLIFEGEYLNGERNGKGKEYNWSGQLIFEGEYLNGERNGKGKEYYNNGIKMM